MDVPLISSYSKERGAVIRVPSDYQLPAETNDFVNMIKKLDLEQRVDFTRSAVSAQGSRQTGLESCTGEINRTGEKLI